MSSMFFINLTITCLSKDNEHINKKVELGMIRINNEHNLKDFLVKYSETGNFQSLLWREVDKHYAPSEVFVDFIKPRVSKGGIMTPGSRYFLRLNFKI